MAKDKWRILNVAIPAAGALVLGLALLASSDKPFQLDFAAIFLLVWCNAYLLGLTMISAAARRIGGAAFTRAMSVTVIVTCIVTGVWFFIVMHAVHHPTSSTAALAILTLPVVGGGAGVIVFVPAYVVLFWHARRSASRLPPPLP